MAKKDDLRTRLIEYRDSEGNEAAEKLQVLWADRSLQSVLQEPLRDDEDLDDLDSLYGEFVAVWLPENVGKVISARNPYTFLKRCFREFAQEKSDTGHGLTVKLQRKYGRFIKTGDTGPYNPDTTWRGAFVSHASPTPLVTFDGEEETPDEALDRVIGMGEYGWSAEEASMALAHLGTRDQNLVSRMLQGDTIDWQLCGFPSRAAYLRHIKKLAPAAPPERRERINVKSQSEGSTRSAVFITEKDYETKMRLIREAGFSVERQIGKKTRV